MTSLQIALCDDNSLSLQLAQLAIQEYERQHADRLCRLHCFNSGTALLSFLDKHKDFSFDLFILDVVMPKPDGIQTGLELRARGDKGRIVYLSASPDFALSAYDVHAYSYLLKPIDRKKLFEILDNTHLSPRRPQARMFAIHIGSSVRLVSFDELISAELKCPYHSLHACGRQRDPDADDLQFLQNRGSRPARARAVRTVQRFLGRQSAICALS